MSHHFKNCIRTKIVCLTTRLLDRGVQTLQALVTCHSLMFERAHNLVECQRYNLEVTSELIKTQILYEKYFICNYKLTFYIIVWTFYQYKLKINNKLDL